MIVSFWIYASYLLDTPERKIRAEARRLALAIEEYLKVRGNPLTIPNKKA